MTDINDTDLPPTLHPLLFLLIMQCIYNQWYIWMDATWGHLCILHFECGENRIEVKPNACYIIFVIFEKFHINVIFVY